MNEETKTGWYDPEATTFGDRLAGAREHAGMSQVDLARRLGVKLKTLQAWENDQSEPRANRVSMMAGLLNVSLMWLLTGEGPGPSAPAETGQLSGEVNALLGEIRDIRAQLARAADHLGRVEKALRRELAEEGLG
ncbi:MAG: helix-turn-helix transcriptional regulator [Roseovarius sp.]